MQDIKNFEEIPTNTINHLKMVEHLFGVSLANGMPDEVIYAQLHTNELAAIWVFKQGFRHRNEHGINGRKARETAKRCLGSIKRIRILKEVVKPKENENECKSADVPDGVE